MAAFRRRTRMTMRELAAMTEIAGTEPRRAARMFLSTAPERAVELTMEAARWKDADVEDFERNGLAVLIDGAAFGRYWLASAGCRRTLLPPAPRVSPRKFVALARAMVDLLVRSA